MEHEVKAWLDAHEKVEFEKHDEIDKRLEGLEDKINDLLKAFEQGKGAVTVIRWLAYVAAMVWAVAEWAKSHVKF